MATGRAWKRAVVSCSMLRGLQRAELTEVTRILRSACVHEDVAKVTEPLLFGRNAAGSVPEVQVAEVGGEMAGVVAVSGGHLVVLAVAPEHRGRGLGALLLAWGQDRAPGPHLRALAGPDGNYLAPGIDVRDTHTIAWLKRRGFKHCGTHTNLLVDVSDNPKVSFAELDRRVQAAIARGVQVRRAEVEERDSVCSMVKTEFSKTWAFEVSRAFGNSEGGVYIATRDGAVVGFASHGGNNPGRGWFGPAGTLPEHRGHGIGATLLVAALIDIAAGGHKIAEIAWIGPRNFYESAVGIIGERTFAVLKRGRSLAV